MSWYDAQRAGLGDEFLAQVDVALARILRRPQGYPTTHGSFQRALVARFPYTIYFRSAGDTVVVFAIYHHRRPPRELANRLAAT